LQKKKQKKQMSSSAVAAAARVLQRAPRACALTGAGVSTRSGIPDYRGPGRPAHRPMMHAEFLGSAAARRRYWLRATLGLAAVARARPNAAHWEVARAAQAGVVTQNVDGLHSHPEIQAMNGAGCVGHLVF
jgi:NAD-dependent SIR2 family protein deacetylase